MIHSITQYAETVFHYIISVALHRRSVTLQAFYCTVLHFCQNMLVESTYSSNQFYTSSQPSMEDIKIYRTHRTQKPLCGEHIVLMDLP